MSAQDGSRWFVHRLGALGIVVATAAASFFALSARLLEPSHSQIKQAVAAKLRDPASAQFGEIFGEGETYCGTVNARNGLGGYAGPRRFVYHREIVFFEPNAPAAPSVSEQADYFEDVHRFAQLSSRCHGQNDSPQQRPDG